MVFTLLTTTLVVAAQLTHAAPALRRQAVSVCNGTFTPITAQAWVDGMNGGWNLGNTLDAIPTEGSWNNPPVDFSTFDVVKKSGFKGVRLPVTWIDHFLANSSSYEVDPTWMQRVEDVVDAALARDLYVLINVHHDATDWADVTTAGANYTLIEEKFFSLWTQIATRFACKSERLSFEPINEPPASTQQHYDEINKLQGLYVQAVQSSGGYNTQRVLNLVGPSEDGALTSQFFKKPANLTNPWLIQYHYYSPYDFIFSAWGKTIWGSDADKAALEADIAHVRGNFTDIPIIIGEYSASTANTEAAARRKYNDFLVRTAKKYNTGTILWDNGADYLDRSTGIWRDQTAIDIIIDTTAGDINSLGDSTVDTTAATQQTSAYIFQQAGQPVTDQVLPFIFNGNTLKSISSGSNQLAEGTDYSVSNNSIIFTSSYISRSITNSTGIAANLTLTFSAGAAYDVALVHWDTPTLATTQSSASSVASGSALNIPVTWKGLDQLATVRAKSAEGDYLVDSFTQYFGPLGDGRTTYNSQWSFDANNVIIESSAVAAVVSLGKPVIFTFEFYPRLGASAANSVNYTLTV